MGMKVLYAENDADAREQITKTLGRITGSLPINREGLKTMAGEETSEVVERIREACAGVEILSVVDGASAIEAIRAVRAAADRIVFVLTDMRMPRANGDQVAEEAIHHDIPVAILTGTPDDILPALRARLARLVEKPAGFSEFVEIGLLIKKAVEKATRETP